MAVQDRAPAATQARRALALNRERISMAAFTSADIDRVRATAAALVDEYNVPGMSIGVVSGNELVYSQGFGYADIETGRPQAPELRQRIGSITKTMVGLCALALVDEGKLSLDERVVDRLPEIRFNGPGETLLVRHLMTHTNGIGEAPTMNDYGDALGKLWSNSPTPTPVNQMYPDGIDIEAPPDTKWAYANHAFCLLGEIVARIEGRRIEEVLARRGVRAARHGKQRLLGQAAPRPDDRLSPRPHARRPRRPGDPGSRCAGRPLRWTATTYPASTSTWRPGPRAPSSPRYRTWPGTPRRCWPRARES